MTEVFYDVDGMYLHCKGHAGGGTAGNDIICAGVSALTMALLNQVNIEEEHGNVRSEWDMKPGEFTISVTTEKEHYRRRIRDYYRVIVIGLRALADNYPDNIRTEEVKIGGRNV